MAELSIPCPCCRQPVQHPPIDVIVDRYRITPQEAAILGALWNGKGYPVKAERIFCSMYADDPDGGPELPRMYAAFKVALCRMRKKLVGSGIHLICDGYARGYRIEIDGMPPDERFEYLGSSANREKWERSRFTEAHNAASQAA